MPAFILFCGGGGGVHWVQVVQGLPVSCGVFRCFVLPFVLCCFACGVLCLDMALFSVLRAFLAWFGVLVWVCIVCVLCVACRAFVRVNS